MSQRQSSLKLRCRSDSNPLSQATHHVSFLLRPPPSVTPRTDAFCRVACTLRFSLRAIEAVFVFSRASVLSVRTSFLRPRPPLHWITSSASPAAFPGWKGRERWHRQSAADESGRGRLGASFGFVDGAHLRCNYVPAIGEAYPSLHLATHPSRLISTMSQRRGDGEIAPVGRDHGFR